MAWIVKNGECGERPNTELIFQNKPIRGTYEWEPKVTYSMCSIEVEDNNVELPKGTIKKIIGRDMSWQDEPIEI